MTVPLLMTKLYIPVPGRYLVGRARLVEKLNQCLEPGCRLALISAPAGFGKTTLIAAWVASAAPPVAWLSLDDGDNDPVIFWSYVIAALQTQQAVGQQALDLLAAQGGALEGKLAVLINELAQTRQPTVLVLDDYHLIRNPQIHQSLAFFIEHLPPHIHLLIASRTDPPLPLALLRGRGQLVEVRLSDLRFSNEDAESYLNSGVGLHLAAGSVQSLNQKTEGWIAGLQMAALALQDLSTRGGATLTSAADFVASFSGSNRFVLDYLIEEVLNRQPEPIQQFLIQTSVLDQLCGPLCAALLEGSETDAQPDAQSMLEYLESCNLFIVPMDQQRYWYRYHHLFADLLRKRLAQSAPERIPGLHRRAIQWYEQNGLIPRAIHHAFEVSDFHKAAALVAQVIEPMWARGENATLLGWMNALPDEEKAAYPHMLTFQVSMLISAGKMKEAEACIPILEQFITASLANVDPQQATPEQAALIAHVYTLRTYIASFYGDRPAVFTHAQAAMGALSRDEDAGKRSGVSLVLSNAYLTEGMLDAAARTLADGAADANRAGKPWMLLSCLSNLAIVLALQGQLSRAAQVCQEGLDLVQQYHFVRSPMTVDLWLAWGVVLCERGALDEAGPYIRQGLDLAQEQQFIWQVAWGQQVQARLLLAQGQLAEAEAVAQAAVQWAEVHPVPAYFASPGTGLLAEIWLRQARLAQAERYLQGRQVRLEDEIQFPHQSEYLALARLGCLRGEADHLSAVNLLERIAQWAEANQHTAAWISALLLLALICPSEQGLAVLEQALDLAEPEGYIQPFVDEGKPLADLLRAAQPRSLHPAYIDRLLHAFRAEEKSGERVPSQEEIALPEAEEGGRSELEPALRRPALTENLPLAEPLSRRELETLQLIAAGLSNKEIAQKMSISLRTVKYYSTGLYNKLGVDSRMQAVVRARELGLI